MADRGKLSILLYGDFTWEYLAASYQQAFEQLGHKVIPFDTRQMKQYLSPWLGHRVGHRLTIRSLHLRRFGARRWNEHLVRVRQEVKPHLLLILNGPLLMPETLWTLRESGMPVFIFHADNPFPEFSNNLPETLPCALETDCYFIWSDLLVKRLEAMCVNRAEYLPFAWDPDVFPYQSYAEAPEYDYDLVFIGGWDKEREAWLTRLAQRFDLKIWGPSYWRTRTRRGSPLRQCWQGGAIRGLEAAKVLQRSRIALNFLRQQNLPDGVNMRTFEVPGCGGFLLATRTQGALENFPEDHAGAYFGSIEECISQIEHYLSQEKARLAIARNAHMTVRDHHQYTDRARRILDVYRGL